ncbi:hypothetical protein AAMO2058_000798900 [Amorphochlora amoebiformis]
MASFGLDAVRVVVRVRPFIGNEAKECKSVVRTIPEDKVDVYAPQQRVSTKRVEKLTSEPGWREFPFDHVFGPTDTQAEVYTVAVKPTIDRFLEGFNSTVFAYGQTSSGKTYTMMGFLEHKEYRGMTPRAIDQMFESIAIAEKKEKHVILLSYLEIYNEQVKDLLGKDTNLRIRQAKNGKFFVPDLSKHLVTSAVQVLTLIKKGSKKRSTASTNQNKLSSRSHSILTFHFERGKPTGEKLTIISSKLNLVDLAGSERFQAESIQRQKESANINRSLVTLGNVIAALSTPDRGKFVPYRDSELTKLLCDSLGGNSHTLMIANVNPCDRNVQETLSTLRYASRTKKIKNKAHKILNPKDAILLKLQREIDALRAKMREKDELIAKLTAAGHVSINRALQTPQRDPEGSHEGILPMKGVPEGGVLSVERIGEDRGRLMKRLESCTNVMIIGGDGVRSRAESIHEAENSAPLKEILPDLYEQKISELKETAKLARNEAIRASEEAHRANEKLKKARKSLLKVATLTGIDAKALTSGISESSVMDSLPEESPVSGDENKDKELIRTPSKLIAPCMPIAVALRRISLKAGKDVTLAYPAQTLTLALF